MKSQLKPVIKKNLKRTLLMPLTRINQLLDRRYMPDPLFVLHISPSEICNLKCRFCAYNKKSSSKKIMPNNLFFDVVDQAALMGFRRFGLTPTTGEIFLDPRLYEKFAYLEENPGVTGYYFTTNLTQSSPENLRELFRFKKLKRINISVCGHDKASFIKITQADKKYYENLVRNLSVFNDLPEQKTAGKTILIRLQSYAHFDFRKALAGKDKSEVLIQVKRALSKGVSVRFPLEKYDNWGGLVTADDIRGMDMNIESNSKKKIGPCSLIFYGFGVFPNGGVSVCSCRDANAALQIGNVKKQPLREILSSAGNEAYKLIIKQQMEGRFQDTCRVCNFYKSIYSPERPPMSDFFVN